MTAALFVAAALTGGAVSMLIGFWCGYMASIDNSVWGRR